MFSEPMVHNEIRVNEEILSAGFFSISENRAICWGESISLRKGSLNEDSELLTKQLNRQW